jgi:oligopeptide/dipeptide ABC transporter ATP-binding protein
VDAAPPVLRVRNLTFDFATEKGMVRAVDGVSFEVAGDETVALVGESGCGKTVTGLSLLRLVPEPPGRYVDGHIELAGRDLLALPREALAEVRGRDVAMIFQEPMTALNPVFTIGSQMVDVLRRHRRLSGPQARAEAAAMLAAVNIPDPARRLDDYPHQLSGGMRQRVMIAMALSCRPRLLVADEPTTALDVTTQAQVLGEFRRLQREFRMALILVTHDLGVVAETCSRAIVMYCGSIVESGPTAELFRRPRHPYTRGLLESVPQVRAERLAELPVIPGRGPDPGSLPAGCRFAARCSRVQPRCHEARPALQPVAAGAPGSVACFNPW